MNATLPFPAIVLSWFTLLAFSIVMVGSAAVALQDNYLSKHIIYVVLALIAFAMCFAFPPRWWNRLYLAGWAGSVAIGVLVLMPGIGHEVNGASRWINLGAFTLQAAEVAKFGLCLYLAGYLHRHGDKLRDDVGVLMLPLVMISVVAVLLIAEPDLGSAVVIVATSVSILFIAGAKIRYFLLFIVLGAALLGALIYDEPYRLERMIAFLDPWPVQYGSGYQLTQALIAFGRGEVFGLGLGEGVQKLFYLPEAHTDFIYAVIAEELGLVGAILLALLLSYLIVQLLLLAKHNLLQGKTFAGYFTYFLGLTIGIQFIISMGVNTGALPTKGLTLPFVSYGGNSLIIFCGMLGLALRACLEPEEQVGDR
ncbi:MAG: putative lipid II flippase FtsW [Pseudomonadales bacterium]